VVDEYSRGFRDGYAQGKEVGLSESGRGGEVAALRAELEQARNQAAACLRCGSREGLHVCGGGF
jgi:hypothetical protein